MNIFNSRRNVAVLVLAGLITLSTPLTAAQRGPSKTKMPPLTPEQQAASKEKEKKEKEEREKEKANQTQKEDTQQTPFGESKHAAKTDDIPSAVSTSSFLEIEEKGDTIVFRRRTPFGQQTWQKKRSDMTSREQELLRSQQARQAANSAAGSAKKAEPGSPDTAASGEAPKVAGQDREKR